MGRIRQASYGHRAGSDSCLSAHVLVHRYLGALPSQTRKIIEARLAGLDRSHGWEPARSYLRSRLLESESF